jgi:hypothetical protein
MSSPDSRAVVADLGEQTTRLAAELRAVIAGGNVEQLPDAAVQALLTAAVKLYVAKREAGAEIEPFIDDSVTATEVTVTTMSMLKAADLQLFELSLWSGFGTT